MTQKHHQEEISGPLDSIEAAKLFEDLPKPKRARIQTEKLEKIELKLNNLKYFPYSLPLYPRYSQQAD
jgi:hypothetical protein